MLVGREKEVHLLYMIYKMMIARILWQYTGEGEWERPF